MDSAHTLLILRHAKAEPAGPDDVARALTKRGRADAAAAGRWLARHGYQPDLVLCSPARRTRETFTEVAAALSATPEVRWPAQLYAASGTSLLALLTELEDRFSTVLLVGHNPSVSQLSAILDDAVGEEEPLRTATVAVHAVAGSWADCGPGRAKLVTRHTARA